MGGQRGRYAPHRDLWPALCFRLSERKVLSAEIRLNWIFSPKISLQAFLQPLIAVGKYAEFKELARPATSSFNYYGRNDSTIAKNEDGYTVDPDGVGPAAAFTFGDPDFNFEVAARHCRVPLGVSPRLDLLPGVDAEPPGFRPSRRFRFRPRSGRSDLGQGR